jgi:sugar lactone lactonase YvrE
MNRRILPLALLVASSAAVVYACSDSKSDNPATTTPPPEAGTEEDAAIPPVPDAGGGVDASDAASDAGLNPDANPIEGIVLPPKLLTTIAGDQFADGPQYIDNALYVALPLATGGLTGERGPGLMVKIDPASGAQTELVGRSGNGADLGPVANSIDKGGNLITAERQVIRRSAADAGAPVTIATGFYVDGGLIPFDSPNDLVARLTDNTIYVTDPGYFATPASNHLVRLTPDGGSSLLEDFPDVPRPNGIALSKDEKTLFVGFTEPFPGKTKPIIRSYVVNADGTVGAQQQFAELPAGSEPDGLATDVNGNLYVAWKQGINVYKSNGTRIGAEPSIPIALGTATTGVTGLTFGGADKMSLYVTTGSGKIYEVRVKVPGLAQ